MESGCVPGRNPGTDGPYRSVAVGRADRRHGNRTHKEYEEKAMPRGSSPKRERQYEHIKEGAEKRGASTGRAEEIAARTVNKERARSGEAKTASKTSTQDRKSAAQRGGERSHSGAQGPTKDQLYAEAKKKGVEGRSSMTKAQLARAVGR